MLELVTKTLARIARYAPPAWTAPIGRGGGGWRRISEPYTGAWQNNDPVDVPTTIGNPTVFACVTLIASSLAKLELQLVREEPAGVWTETSNPAYSPLLRRPNRYQITTKFVMVWLLSKLTHGNAYVLKARDNRNVVTALYPLDPARVTPLVASDGAVYYRVDRDPLRGTSEAVDLLEAVDAGQAIVVPASELIHDPMYPLFHPLIGVSPLFAAALPAIQGLNIQNNSTRFFANGAQPSGILTAPQGITDKQADKLAKEWKEQYTGDNAGKVAILTGDLKYTGAVATGGRGAARRATQLERSQGLLVLPGPAVPDRRRRRAAVRQARGALSPVLHAMFATVDRGSRGRARRRPRVRSGVAPRDPARY